LINISFTITLHGFLIIILQFDNFIKVLDDNINIFWILLQCINIVYYSCLFSTENLKKWVEESKNRVVLIIEYITHTHTFTIFSNWFGLTVLYLWATNGSRLSQCNFNILYCVLILSSLTIGLNKFCLISSKRPLSCSSLERIKVPLRRTTWIRFINYDLKQGYKLNYLTHLIKHTLLNLIVQTLITRCVNSICFRFWFSKFTKVSRLCLICNDSILFPISYNILI